MKQKILLVEDDPFMGEFYSLILQQNGYKVELAENGSVALGILQEYFPDLIVSDIDMPGMNGYEFRKEILNSAVFKDIPFLFSSTRNVNHSQLNMLDLSHNDLISKRNGPQFFIEKIKASLT